ncbi:MAG TPA: lipid-A-disaccharide synthase N-terminal domain-containing protein [Phycisphaerales bacterium]|nr:lipid-A-disaccharide synthase N-terminal domain-containing protein [Phycisphaerales bacterium]
MKFRGKRIKWEPGALFILVLLVGVWLAVGPDTFRRLPTREGATTFPIRIADSRGVLETSKEAGSGESRFRVIMRDGFVSPDMSKADFERTFGASVLAQATAPTPNWIFRKLNITSWVGFIWLAIGFGGQLAFSGRMIIQWWVSEKMRQSHVPMAFWLWSLIGSVMLFSYFVWRQDPVGVLGQCTGVVVYARNLRLIYKSRRRAERAAASEADSMDEDS